MLELASTVAHRRAGLPSSLDATYAGVLAVLDAVGQAGGLLDRDRHVVAMNAAGQALAEQELSACDGRLVGKTRAADQTLERLMQSLDHDWSGVATFSNRSPVVVLRMVRLAVPVGCADRIVTFSNSSETRLPSEAVLRDTFGLTAAEAYVALSIARGVDLASIATSRSVSIATVRTHLRVVFDKTGTRRQLSLAVLIAGTRSSGRSAVTRP